MNRRIFLLALVALVTLQSHEAKEPLLVETTTEDCAVLHVAAPVTDDLVADLKAINGVEAVMNIRKYSVMIERAELYTWDELRPAILAAAKRHSR